MSYQTEERYWSDYLRIALPIAGLLLLLGVFWYWANSFIGDDNSSPERTPDVAVQTTPLTAPTATSVPSNQVVLTPATVAPTTVVVINTPEGGGGNDTGGDNGADNGGGASSGTFKLEDIVIVNEDDVNMRASAGTDADVVDQLAKGTELRILDGQSITSGEIVWWNVADTTNEVEGWVAEQFLESVGG